MAARVVCFDLGGVLINIHHTWDGAMSACGLAYNAELGPLGGFPEFDRYQNGEICREEFLAELATYLGTDEESAAQIHMAILREECAGATDLVRELKASGAVCGCLSNTNADHWETFFDGVRFPFGPLLDVRIGSHVVGRSKPQAEMYRAFEEACGHLGGDIEYFDDNASNVASAQALGWNATVIDPFGDPVQQMRQALALDR